ncbi:MAG: hypothetical protein MR548_09090 [Prevotella sp.]|nr:hypothetical protein [Prevotella sp.]
MNSNTTSSLAPGTILHGEVYNYKITKVLGQGSYGITYLAETVKQQRGHMSGCHQRAIYKRGLHSHRHNGEHRQRRNRFCLL